MTAFVASAADGHADHPVVLARTARHAVPHPVGTAGACQDGPVAIILLRRTEENDRAWLQRLANGGNLR